MNTEEPKLAFGERSASRGRDGFKVVAMGGGTGLATLLRGLKRYITGAAGSDRQTSFIRQLCAVVTVSDDGGSSGKLRQAFDIVAPGDVRNCIVALSEDEALLARLFQFRFKGKSALAGHSFGNLFLTALSEMTGDFATAVELSAEILKTRGSIFPATTANVGLEAVMHDGTEVRGETHISASTKRITRLRLIPEDAPPMPQTLLAIAGADLITIGPGSLFTSLAPNLLVRGVAEAIAASSAIKVYIGNLMTEANESLGLSAAGHIQALYRHAGRPIFDYALVNAAPVSPEMAAMYASEGACQIEANTREIEALGVIPILGDFLEEGEVARHATGKVAAELMRLLGETRLATRAKAAKHGKH
jgi:uncharacterized cofD-like protein